MNRFLCFLLLLVHATLNAKDPCDAFLRGVSSSFVNDVNVITGQYVPNEVDMVVPGALPIVISRSYRTVPDSNATARPPPAPPPRKQNDTCMVWPDRRYGDYEVFKSWEFQHTSFLFVGRHEVQTQEGGWPLLSYLKVSKTNRYELEKGPLIINGLTNARDVISGQTNLSNTVYRPLSKNKGQMTTGAGVKRVYKRIDTYDIGDVYGIHQEIYPNRQYLDYFWDSREEIQSIRAFSPAGLSLGGASFFYQGKKKHRDKKTTICFSNSQSATYDYVSYGKTRLLTKVVRPQGPNEEYDYLDDHCLSGINRPDGRKLEIHYEPDGKVYKLYASLDSSEQLTCTHTFRYHPKYTSVMNAQGHSTHYYYDKFKRLTSIYSFLSGNLHTQEKFYWSDKTLNEQGRLVCKALTYQEDPNHIYCQSLIYDPAGNVVEEKILGNLTGRNTAPLLIDAKGQVLDTGVECYTIHREYSPDTLNLLYVEKDNRQTRSFVYEGGTNLKVAEYLWAPEGIKKRHFYTYDHHGFLIQEVEDDGILPDSHDLTGVTERHFKKITVNLTSPVGYPKSIDEYVLDISTGEEHRVKRTDYKYSRQGYLIQEDHYNSDDVLFASTTRTYDAKGNLASIVNAEGEKTERKYDLNNNLIYEQGPRLDFHKEFVYDYGNRLIEEIFVCTSGERYSRKYTYDALSQKIQETDIYGNVTNYVYDELGRLIEIHQPEVTDESGLAYRPIERRTYDLMGNCQTKMDMRGAITSTTYNIRSQPIHTIFPDGTEEIREYTLEGWLERLTEPNGVTTRTSYDYQGRPIEIRTYDNAGVLVSCETKTYNALHLLSETDAAGETTSYFYDQAGRLKKEVSSTKEVVYTYDPEGRLYKKSIEDRTQIYLYDRLNRVIEERTEDDQGHVLKKSGYAYDCNGNVIAEKSYSSQGIATKKTSYNLFGQKETVIDELGNTTQIHHTSFKNGDRSVYQAESIDPLGRVTLTIHDALKRPVKIIFKDAFGKELHRQELQYDRSGNVQNVIETISTPKGVRQTVKATLYDFMNRPVEKYEALGTPEQKKISHVYQGGHKVQTQKADGVILSFIYDSLGRKKEVISSDGTIAYCYHYDINDRLVACEDRVKGFTSHRVFDTAGRLIEETLGSGLTIGFSYNALDRQTALSLPDQTEACFTYRGDFLKSVSYKQYTAEYEDYDLSGRLLKAKIGPVFVGFTYDAKGQLIENDSNYLGEKLSYNAVGHLISKQRADGRGNYSCRYNYDALDQLASEQGLIDKNYLLDSVGCRYDGESWINALHQVLSNEQASFTYDPNGNLIRTDKDGETRIFCYDALNRLISAHTSTSNAFYTYDCWNRRLISTVNGETSLYLYQNQQEIGRSVNGEIQELRIVDPNQNSERGATFFLQLKGETYFPLHDHQGNIATLVNSTEESVGTYRYSAFGETIHASPLSPWRFSSKRLDQETGFIYFGERYYLPTEGRWITQDPLGTFDGPNCYAYVRHNPLTHFDAYGLLGEEGFWSSCWNSTKSAASYCWDSSKTAVGAFGYGGYVALDRPIDSLTFNAPPPPGQGWLYNTCYSAGQGLVLAGQIVPGFSAGVKAWQAARIGTSLGWQAAKSSFWKESGKSAVKSMAAMEVATAEAATVEVASAITTRQTAKKIILERRFNVDVNVLSRAG